jgi:hypothetical protein
MALTLQFNESTLASGLDRMAEKAGAAVLLYAGTKAPIIEADMKSNRPWNDQTGAAKASLNVRVSNPKPNIV